MRDKKWGYEVNRMCDKKWGTEQTECVTSSGGIEQTECDKKLGYEANRMSQIAARMKILRQEEEKEGEKKVHSHDNEHSQSKWKSHTATYSEDFPHTFLHVPHCPAHNFLPIPQWPHFPDVPLTSLAHPHSQPPWFRIPLMKKPNDSYIR